MFGFKSRRMDPHNRIMKVPVRKRCSAILRVVQTQVWLLALAALATATCWGQTSSGRLSGTLLDPSGAAIVGAQITIRSESSGAVSLLVTDASGAFHAVSLLPGLYTVEADVEGFRRQVVQGVKIDIAKETSVPPIQLELGPLTETVVVEGGVSQVQTTNAELSSTVTMEQIEHLPLIGRDPLNLIHLESGVAYQGRTATVINGQRTSFSNVTLDGINIQDNFIRGNGLNFIPNRLLLNQVSEFTITTQNGNPAFGGGASQVNFTTRSGTNDFHGNVYWHNRNSKLSANQWFSNKTGTPKPFLNLNQIGGSLGGPIIKNKLLFYTNYEAYRRRAESLANSVILTQDARQGVFTYRDQRTNRAQKVNVLRATGTPVDPGVADLMESVPDGDNINNFDVGDSDRTLLRNTAGYRFNIKNDSDRDAVTNRVDYIFSDRHLFSGTYQYARDQLDRPDAGVGFHRFPVVKEFSHTQLVSIGWNWSTSVVPLTVLDNGVGFGGALDFGEDILCRSCPDKGFGRLVARFQVLVDGGLEFGNTAEHAAADALLCQLAEPALDEIEPRRRRGNEVKVEAGVLREPLLHLLMLVRGVVVHDQMQLQRRWRFAVDLA